jgi:hypothetical protein
MTVSARSGASNPERAEQRDQEGTHLAQLRRRSNLLLQIIESRTVVLQERAVCPTTAAPWVRGYREAGIGDALHQGRELIGLGHAGLKSSDCTNSVSDRVVRVA